METLERSLEVLAQEAIDGMNEVLDSLNLSSAVRAQIDSGLLASGQEIRPTYTNDPFFRTPEESQRWIRRYRKYEVNSYPQWNLPTRHVDTPNLNITGKLFFDYITADNNNGIIEIQAVGSPIEAELRAKYGNELLGLSPQIKSVIEERLQERLASISTQHGFEWVADV